MKSVDTIIIGQGLAGSVLALQSLRMGHSVVVVHSSKWSQASRVAAGLYNPFMAQKNQVLRAAKEKWTDLHDFYTYAETTLGKSFYHPMKMYRPYLEKNKEILGPEHPFQEWIETEVDQAYYSKWVDNQDGGVVTKYAGYVNTVAFLDATANYLQKHNAYLNTTFHESEITILEDEVEWRGMKAKRLVLCLGWKNRACSLFNWLPISLLKGDVFRIQMEGEPLPEIINKKHFIIPLENDVYRAGSTYARNFDTIQPEESGKKELEQGLKDMLKPDFNVIEHLSGIRPNSGDHHPMVGPHPYYPQIFCINGLGSKGVAYAPYAINALLNYICNGNEINSFINVQRFYSLYYKNLK
jgi:glycine/D-amino acid oxidase-like deaminating enzyme